MDNRIVSVDIVDGELIITYQDGSTESLGPVPNLDPEELSAAVQRNAGDIAGLKRDVAALQEAVAGLGTSVETAEDDIDDIQEDVAELKNDFTDLSEKVDSAFVTETATGSIASFTDGADDIPVKDLSVAIEPVQDLHGQSAPYPAGGGKNLYEGVQELKTNTSLPIEYTVNVQETCTFQFTASSDYTNSDNYWLVYLELQDGTKTYVTPTAGQTVSRTIQATTENPLVKVYVRIVGITAGKVYNLQLEKGSTATAYAPYSNICPISGWSGANVTRAGGNLLNPVAKFAGFWAPGVGTHLGPLVNDYSSFSNDTITVMSPEWNGNGFASTPLVEGKQYKITGEINAVNPRCSFVMTDADMNITRTLVNRVETGNVNTLFTVASGEKYVVISLINVSGNTGVTFKNPSVSESGVYEPYQGETYEVDWTTEAGTVYGGTLDVVSGVLTVDYSLIDMGTLTYARTLIGSDYAFSAIVDGKKNGKTNMICSCYLVSGVGFENLHMVGHASSSSIYIRDDAYSDTSIFKTAMSGMTLAYELATPHTYQLTPQEVATVLGQNSIFADCGNVDVQYRADTKLYIDKVLSA